MVLVTIDEAAELVAGKLAPIQSAMIETGDFGRGFVEGMHVAILTLREAVGTLPEGMFLTEWGH